MKAYHLNFHLMSKRTFKLQMLNYGSLKPWGNFKFTPGTNSGTFIEVTM